MKYSLKNKLLLIAAVSICFSVTLTARAADVRIEWLEPEKYRDIRSGEESQKSFQDRVITVLTEYFESAAAVALPADQTLYLKITDVDLAGEVEYFFFRHSRPVRVLRDVHFPSIEFNYVLKDADGNVLKSGEENIRDIGYLYSGTVYIKDPPFDYEKRMIDDWFEKNFK